MTAEFNPPLRVFVYGTLKPGECNYQRFCQRQVVRAWPGQVQGELFDLAVGYPALTVGNRWVQGVLLAFQDPEILTSLDALENYQPGRSPQLNLYERHWVTVFSLPGQPLGEAWVYRMTLEKVQQLGGQPLSRGRWDSSSP